jgi:hypothetical protein
MQCDEDNGRKAVYVRHGNLKAVLADDSRMLVGICIL